MKRYVSLAGAMLLGTVIAQEKASALKTEVAKAAKAELKAAAPVALEAKRVYRSDVSAQTPDSVVSKSENTPDVSANRITSRERSVITIDVRPIIISEDRSFNTSKTSGFTKTTPDVAESQCSSRVDNSSLQTSRDANVRFDRDDIYDDRDDKIDDRDYFYE
jgi:hypothetical protein